MNKNLTVEIFVPMCNEPEKIGMFGTGYPVGRGLILTALHVLEPNSRDFDSPIEVRWNHPRLEETEKGWMPIEGVEWHSVELDVAVLSCAFPPSIDSWGVLSSQKPVDSMKWVSEGFAAAGGKSACNLNSRVPMQGQVCSAGDTELCFELMNNGPPEDEEGWSGVSGSPVFVGYKIIGVINTCPKHFRAVRLMATPAWKLLDDQSFRDVVGYDNRKKKVKVLRDWLKRKMGNSSEVIRCLAQEIESSGTPIEGATLQQKSHHIAEHLLDMKIEKMVLICRQAQYSLERADLLDDVDLISRIVREMLPVCYDFGGIKALCSGQSEVEHSFISLPVCTRTVAEIVMADLDNRDARYRIDGETPVGEYQLPAAPESGWDESGKDFVRSMDMHLSNLFDADFVQRWDECLVGRFGGDECVPGMSSDKQEKLVNIELDYLSKTEKRTYYYIFRLPEEMDESARVMAIIEDLNKRYESIKFLSLNDDWIMKTREIADFRPLKGIISSAQPSE